jgi:hypothetical protein
MLRRFPVLRGLVLGLSMLLANGVSAHDNVSVGVNVGFNLVGYPHLVPIPGYPVYYAPQVPADYFFYDGLYWVYAGGNWYESSWYNGPWMMVAPVYVPAFVLRVPVRYYRYAPPSFHHWHADAAPHWGEVWGPAWQAQRHDWDHWNHHVPHRAPLPSYQHEYAGNRYPAASPEQYALRAQRYRYHPNDEMTQRHWNDGVPRTGDEHQRDDDGHGEHERNDAH